MALEKYFLGARYLIIKMYKEAYKRFLECAIDNVDK